MTSTRGRRRVHTRREGRRHRRRTRRNRVRARARSIRASTGIRSRASTVVIVHRHERHDILVPFHTARPYPRGRRRLVVGTSRGSRGVASFVAVAGSGRLARGGGKRLRGVAGGAEGVAASRASIFGDGDCARGDALSRLRKNSMVARVGRGECGAHVSSGATTRPGPGRGRAERLVGAPGSERVRAERRAVLLEIVQEVRVVRRVVRVAVEGGVGGVAVASSARARHAPSRDVLAAGGGPAMRRRAAAAQRRGQVLGREHLPRRGVPEVHVRVRRVRENRPRGLGRGGASLEGEGKRGTRGERVVGQRKRVRRSGRPDGILQNPRGTGRDDYARTVADLARDAARNECGDAAASESIGDTSWFIVTPREPD